MVWDNSTLYCSGEFVEGTQNRIIKITGPPVCAQTAHTLIINRLRQSQQNDA